MSREKSVKRTKKQIQNRSRRLFLPYPLILFLMLCAGTYLVATTLHSYANDIHVTAKVSAPLVTDPAAIGSPVEGQRFSAIPVPVSGTCPLNAAYVEIFSNGVMKGTAICDGSSNFSLSVDLFPGANSLVARVFNSTDDEGPISAPVTVYYDAPQPPVVTPPSGGQKPPITSKPPASNPLQLYTEFVYKGYYVGEQVSWPFKISGGTSPYSITIDWGDGSTSKQVQKTAGDFEISHIYQRAGGEKGAFTIKVNAADSAGSKASQQFFVIVVNKQGLVTNGNIFSKPPPSLHSNGWLWLAWPAYLIVLIMTLSFWLGEREELLILKKKGRLKRS
jgi:hypothetical protein